MEEGDGKLGNYRKENQKPRRQVSRGEIDGYCKENIKEAVGR